MTISAPTSVTATSDPSAVTSLTLPALTVNGGCTLVLVGTQVVPIASVTDDAGNEYFKMAEIYEPASPPPYPPAVSIWICYATKGNSITITAKLGVNTYQSENTDPVAAIAANFPGSSGMDSLGTWRQNTIFPTVTTGTINAMGSVAISLGCTAVGPITTPTGYTRVPGSVFNSFGAVFMAYLLDATPGATTVTWPDKASNALLMSLALPAAGGTIVISGGGITDEGEEESAASQITPPEKEKPLTLEQVREDPYTHVPGGLR